MATDRMDVLELLRKATSDGDVDLLREGVRVLSQARMDAEVSAEIGATMASVLRSDAAASATAIAPGAGTPASAAWSSTSPSCARAATFRPARAAAPRRTSAAERGAGSLRGRRVNPSGGGPGGGAGHH